MNKLVSIIIPTYKRPDIIKRAIESVLKQTYHPIEVIVVDDNHPGSRERIATEDQMESYKNNPLIKYVKHEKNKNGSAARNTGARLSEGEYLAFLDDDDEYLPAKIEAQVKRLEELDDSWGACYCRYYRKSGKRIISRSTEKREGWVSFHELCRNFWHGGGTGPLVRRNVFEDLKGFDESFNRNQDYEYMYRLTKKYKLAFVDIYGAINYVDAYRESKVTYDETLKSYLNMFEVEIEELDQQEKIKFKKMIALQSFRHYFFKEHKIKKAFNELTEGNVNLYLLLKYLSYLFYRKSFKVSCGFNI